MWGKLSCPVRAAAISRNTPTHVGKTCACVEHQFRCSEHPHACGENTLDHNYMGCFCGTPPRMWGKLDKRKREAERMRNTPTHVGKTIYWGTTMSNQPEHPHACGENDITLGGDAYESGTPPRMWGKRAYLAGLHRLVSEHPHACGENGDYDDRQAIVDWNTPTHVGKTIGYAQAITLKPEHPHACGENTFNLTRIVCINGTPPRMWGKRLCGRVLLGKYRGTPPRMWGKRPHPKTTPNRPRNTPTHVGKTKIYVR